MPVGDKKSLPNGKILQEQQTRDDTKLQGSLWSSNALLTLPNETKKALRPRKKKIRENSDNSRSSMFTTIAPKPKKEGYTEQFLMKQELSVLTKILNSEISKLLLAIRESAN